MKIFFHVRKLVITGNMSWTDLNCTTRIFILCKDFANMNFLFEIFNEVTVRSTIKLA